MDSSNKINYELRPCKFAERRMFLALLQEICVTFGLDEYRYVGFGSIYYTDFKIFHKELHINNMVSIEGSTNAFIQKRADFNLPYNCIELCLGQSTDVLTDLTWDEKNIVWMDYDSVLHHYMFQDIEHLFQRLVVGSCYFFSCNKQLRNSETNTNYQLNEFEEHYGDLVPDGLEQKELTKKNEAYVIRQMLLNKINSILRLRNETLEEEEKLIFKQVIFIQYEEHRGARMVTLGGFLDYEFENRAKSSSMNLTRFPFMSNNEDIYIIDIPKLTKKEVDFVNSKLPEEDIKELNTTVDFLTEDEITNYAKNYKYLPHYLDVRF